MPIVSEMTCACSAEMRNVSNRMMGGRMPGMKTWLPELQNSCASERKISATPNEEITV